MRVPLRLRLAFRMRIGLYKEGTVNTRNHEDNGSPSLLIVSAYPVLRDTRADIAGRNGWLADQAGSVREAMRCLLRRAFDAVLLCSTIGPQGIETLMREFRRRNPSGRVIAMQDGQFDWKSGDFLLERPVTPQQLSEVLRKVYEPSSSGFGSSWMPQLRSARARAAGSGR
jgi:hypothetical protein